MIVIKPSWEEYTASPDDIVIELDPGAAFGTGTHPTTAMCIRALEKLVRGGMRVLMSEPDRASCRSRRPGWGLLLLRPWIMTAWLYMSRRKIFARTA